MKDDVEKGFKDTIKKPKRKVKTKPKPKDDQERFVESAMPRQQLSDEASHVLHNSDAIVNVLKRYDTQWGDMSQPNQGQADIMLPNHADQVWTELFGHEDKPKNVHEMVGNIREALQGALTEQHMIQQGTPIDNRPPEQVPTQPLPQQQPGI